MRHFLAAFRAAAAPLMGHRAEALRFVLPGFQPVEMDAMGGRRARSGHDGRYGRRWHRAGVLLSWILLALMPLPGLAGDRSLFATDAPPPPPEPNPLDIEVPRGGAVWITLSAYSITSPVIRYRIKRPAKAGQLVGAPELVTANTGRVKYRPPKGVGPGEDSFSYQVQSADGVSAPAEVHITFTDTDPVLITPSDVEFGQLLPGETARRPLVLQNIGGGLAQGTVRVPDGWTLEGDPAYHVGAGEKQTFTLVFQPSAAGRYTGDIEYSSNPERATDLNGEVVAPIAVTSGTVELREAGEMRIGTIHVENRTDKARTFKVTPGPGLDTDAMVTAPANGAADILVRAKGGNGEVEDRVTVEGDGFKAEVQVHAAPVIEPGAVAIAAAKPGETAAIVAATPVRTAQVANANPAGPAPPEPPPATSEAGMPVLNLPPLAPAADEAAEPAAPRMPIWPLGMGRVTQTQALIGCNFKGPQAAQSYRVELQTVGIDPKGMPMAVWQPFTRVALQEKKTMVVAQLLNLQPGKLYVVRLVGLDGHGRVIESSTAGRVWTPAARQGGGWRWVAVVVAAGAGGFWFWRKRGGKVRGRGWA